jgi:hypothetical protein
MAFPHLFPFRRTCGPGTRRSQRDQAGRSPRAAGLVSLTETPVSEVPAGRIWAPYPEYSRMITSFILRDARQASRLSSTQDGHHPYRKSNFWVMAERVPDCEIETFGVSRCNAAEPRSAAVLRALVGTLKWAKLTHSLTHTHFDWIIIQ